MRRQSGGQAYEWSPGEGPERS